MPCFGRLAELMKAESSMQKTGASVGGHPAELLAHTQGEGPLLLPHQMMQAKLEHFRPILEARLNRIKLGQGFAPHAQLCVAAGGLQLPFELHDSLFSKNRAQKR
jgi:hypothetical protein